MIISVGSGRIENFISMIKKKTKKPKKLKIPPKKVQTKDIPEKPNRMPPKTQNNPFPPLSSPLIKVLNKAN